jgi:hypothetical protein
MPRWLSSKKMYRAKESENMPLSKGTPFDKSEVKIR